MKEPASRWRRLGAGRPVSFIIRHWAIIIALLALVEFMGTVGRFFVFQGADGATYLMLGRALANGQGYTNIYSSPPEPHTKYPFFFPLMLAGLIKIFGENIVAIRIVMAVIGALMVLASALLWADRGEKFLAFLTAVILATLPFILEYHFFILSEIPFTASVVLSLFLFERAAKSDRLFTGRYFAGVALAMIAYFIRSTGVVLIPALAVAALLRPVIRERWKRNFMFAAAWTLPLILAAGVWQIRCQMVSKGQGATYFRQFLAQDHKEQDSPTVNTEGMIERIKTGTDEYLRYLALSQWPFTVKMSESRKNLARRAGLVIFLFSLIGLMHQTFTWPGSPEFYSIFYIGLILVWPARESRFLIPLYPMLIYYLLLGFRLVFSVLTRFAPRFQKAAAWAAVSILTLTILGINISGDIWAYKKIIIARKMEGFDVNSHFRIISINPGMGYILNLTEYLRNHTEPGTVILARKAALVALVTERPVVGGPFEPDPDEFIKGLERKNVRYVMVEGSFEENKKYILPAIRRNKEKFKLVHKQEGSGNMIFEFIPEN